MSAVRFFPWHNYYAGAAEHDKPSDKCFPLLKRLLPQICQEIARPGQLIKA
jgi:hypothetical protein